MTRFYHLLIFVCALCVSLAFAQARASAQSVYPDGLHGPSDVVSGIYPGTNAGNCCWLGAQGALTVRAPYGADTLLLTVVEPDYAVRGGKQSLRVQINGEPVRTQCCFGAGEYEFTFPLPRNVEDHPVLRVRLWAARTFVPRDIGMNLDPRHLSVLIRGVAFSNSATGVRISTSSVPDFQSAPLVWAILGGLVVLALTLYRPIYGAVALIVTDPFLLAHSFHGTTITLPKAALVAAAIGLLPRLRRETFGNASAPWLLFGAQALFVLSMAVSSVHAAAHGAALRETLKAMQYLATIAVAYLAYRLDPDEGILRLALAAAAALVVVPALAQEFAGAPEAEIIRGHAVARIAGPLEGPNQLAGYLGIVVPAMLAFALRRPAIAFERAVIALSCIACVLTFSKAGIAALALAVALLLAIRYEWTRRVAIGSIAAAVLAGTFAFAAASFAGVLPPGAERIFGATSDAQQFNGGLGVRSELWHAAYALWRSHPIVGIGPGNFELAVGRYDPGVHTHANGMYFQVLAEQGIVGFTAMLAVIAASIGVFVRRLNQPLALAACVGAVAMAFHQIVDCMWIYPKVGVMWWLLLAFGAAAVDLTAEPERVAERAVA